MNLKNQVSQLVADDRSALRDEVAELIKSDRAQTNEELSRLMSANRSETQEALAELIKSDRARTQEELSQLISTNKSETQEALAELIKSDRARTQEELAQLISTDKSETQEALAELIKSDRARTQEELAQLISSDTSGIRQQLEALIDEKNRALREEFSALLKDDLARTSKDISDLVRKYSDDGAAERESYLDRSNELGRSIQEGVRSDISAQKDELAEHMHRESVKVYKNVQASTQESINQALETGKEELRSMVETTVRGQNEALRSGIQGNMVQVLQNAFKSEAENTKNIVKDAVKEGVGANASQSIESIRKLLYVAIVLLGANLVGLVVVLLWIFMII